jgi:hypothetical protein
MTSAIRENEKHFNAFRGSEKWEKFDKVKSSSDEMSHAICDGNKSQSGTFSIAISFDPSRTN